jgi:hypothetical protein
LLFMFVFDPGVNQDKFSAETLWEAVHPFHWFFDTVATLGLIGFGLFLTGYLGKFCDLFTDLSVGAIKVIAGICMAACALFFV